MMLISVFFFHRYCIGFYRTVLKRASMYSFLQSRLTGMCYPEELLFIARDCGETEMVEKIRVRTKANVGCLEMNIMVCV